MQIIDLQKNIIQKLSNLFPQEEARAISQLLLMRYTQKNSLFILLHPDYEVNISNEYQINEAVDKALHNMPVHYIIGQKEFYGLSFEVNESVLIPRSETEELVDWILKNEQQPLESLLDIGCGSGCIAVSLAKNGVCKKTFAVDISEQAISLARRNAIENQTKIDFHCLDVFSEEFERQLNTQFHLIVSNPPYVRNLEKAQMSANVLNYEPHNALFVKDEDPLCFYHRILEIGQQLLISDGKIYFEINEALGEEMIKLIQRFGYKNITLKKDMQNKDRFITGTKGV